MTRWAVALATLATAGCHSSGYVQQDASAGDAASDSSGPCVCETQSTTGPVAIACTQEGCVDGLQVLCSGAGDLLSLDAPCGDAGSDAGDGGPCVPTCGHNTCGSPNGCGGTCQCPPGIPCNPDQTCGNGCNLTGQQPCVVGSSSPNSCCSDGYQCKAGDSGPALCCVVSGSNGTCGKSTDCCDYPKASCDTFSSTCN